MDWFAWVVLELVFDVVYLLTCGLFTICQSVVEVFGVRVQNG